MCESLKVCISDVPLDTLLPVFVDVPRTQQTMLWLPHDIFPRIEKRWCIVAHKGIGCNLPGSDLYGLEKSWQALQSTLLVMQWESSTKLINAEQSH